MQPGRCGGSTTRRRTARRAARSAPARTRNGDLPPSSVTHGTSRSPQLAATFRPVATAPVNMTPSTRLDEGRSRVARAPRRRGRRREGSPPSARAPPSGATSAASPRRASGRPRSRRRAARAASAALLRIGKFHGPTTPTTPSGTWWTSVRRVAKRSVPRLSGRERPARRRADEAGQLAEVEDLGRLPPRAAAFRSRGRGSAAAPGRRGPRAASASGAAARSPEAGGRPRRARRRARPRRPRPTSAAPAGGSSARSSPVAGETTRREGAALTPRSYFAHRTEVRPDEA